MPAAVLPAQASVLKDTPNGRRNILNSSTKRRYDGTPVVNNLAPPKKYYNGRNVGSSQPKSHFEEEVLEKLTQNINGLKQKNAEKDQQWARPDLSDFDSNTQSLCFQQIEAEEGTLHGGKTTVKLFGCTEVGHAGMRYIELLLLTHR
jgi:DNA polymerase delta subunit 1